MRNIREEIASQIIDNTSEYFNIAINDSDDITEGSVNKFVTVAQEQKIDNLPPIDSYVFPLEETDVIQRKYVDDLTVSIGAGDMLKTQYDPTFKLADAFNMDNMDEGADTKIMTAAERTKLGNVPANTNSELSTITTNISGLQANEFKFKVASIGTNEIVYQNATEMYRDLDSSSGANRGPLYRYANLKYPGRYKITADVKAVTNATININLGVVTLDTFYNGPVYKIQYFQTYQTTLSGTGVYQTITFNTNYLDGPFTMYLFGANGGVYIKNLKIECTPIIGEKETLFV